MHTHILDPTEVQPHLSFSDVSQCNVIVSVYLFCFTHQSTIHKGVRVHYSPRIEGNHLKYGY